MSNKAMSSIMSKIVASVKTLSGTDLLAAVTLSYCLLGSLFLFALGANPIYLLRGLITALPKFAIMATDFMPLWGLFAVAVGLGVMARIGRFSLSHLRQLGAAIIYFSLFSVMFGLIKNNLAVAMPFWADALFTRLDLSLHFGHNPRDFLTGLSELNTSTVYVFYIRYWVFVATFLPVLLIAFDHNRARARQFIWLWALCWILLGNILALGFMSAGPVFAGMVPGIEPEAHRAVAEMLARPDAGALLAVRNDLWAAYTSDQHMIGAGISAFPSVHVGMATVIGLYLLRLGSDLSVSVQRPVPSRLLALAGWAVGLSVMAIFLILSVYLGWHYAVDGYASVLIIAALNWHMEKSGLRVDRAEPHSLVSLAAE